MKLFKKLVICLTVFLSSTSACFAYDLVVAKDGSGDYTTVQAAINAVPAGLTSVYQIYIKNGVYEETVVIPSTKPFIQLIGQSVANTIITYNNGASTIVGGIALGTAGSSTVIINATDFSAMNITFQNTFGDGSQAVAVEINADRVAFQNCRFMGNQDTLYTKGAGNPRHYFLHCYIDGNVDFIFGSSIDVFDTCVIYAKTRTVAGSTGTSYMTAANTTAGQSYGYVFRGCTAPMNQGTTYYYLGRPWQNSTGFTPTSSPPQANNKVVYLNCTLSSQIFPAGWVIWDAGTDTTLIYDGEYKSTNIDGTPANVSSRVTWSHQLSDSNAATYTLSNIFGSWDPCTLLNCSAFTPSIAVSNFMATKGATLSTLNWNISWAMTGIVYNVYRSTDGISYSLFNTQTAANDTNVNFSTTDVLPPAGSIYHYYVVASLPGFASDSTDTVIISSAPTITLGGALFPFTQYLGTPSGVETYSVSGTNLAANVTLTPPVNFELSTDGGTTWYGSSSPVTLTESGGVLAATIIYVRLNASADGSYSGNIVHTSTGAITVNDSVSGITTNPPLVIPIVLEEWPFTANDIDSAAVRATGVAATVPRLQHLYLSSVTTPPAYSGQFGEALSANSGAVVGTPGDGYWTNGTSHDGPGGTLQRTYYQEFSLTPQTSYRIRVDSFILNADFDGSSSTTTMMGVYSRSNFTLDSTNIVGYTFSSSGDIPLPNSTSGPVNVWRLALLTGDTGVYVNPGDTLKMRFYFTCSSSSAGKFACLKNVYAKGLSNSCVAEPSAFTISTPNVCEGAQNVVYTVPLDTSVTSYTWSYSGTGATFTSTTNSVSVNFDSTATNGTFSVVANAACGTSTAQTLGITLNSSPVVGPVTGTYTVCQSAATTLSDTTIGGAWSSSDASIALVDPVLGIVSGAGAGSAVITYSVTSAYGCSATNTATVTVTASIAAGIGNITGTTTICAGVTTTLADTTIGGSWSSGTPAVATIDGSGDITGLSAGTTNVSYTFTNSCGTAITYSVVTVNPLPVAGTISGSAGVCVGATDALNAAGTIGSGIWSSGNTSIATVDSLTGIVNGIGSGTVAITYSVTNGCGSTSTFSVIAVNSIPVITAGSDTSICSGTSATLSASGGTTYSWAPSTGLSVTTGSGISADPAGTLTYTVTGTTLGCSNTATQTVTIIGSPTVSAGADTSICTGSFATLSASGGTTYSWAPSTGLTVTTGSGISADPTGTITYTVTGTAGGCSNTATQTITVNSIPVIIAGSGDTICAGSPGTLTASGGTTYLWIPAAGLSATTGASITASPTVTTTYTVTGTTSGCSAAATETVTVIPTTPLTASIVNSASSYTLTTTAGSYTVYWFVNGVLNTTLISTPTWTFTVTAGDTDTIAAVVVPLSGCYNPDTVISDTLHVNGGPLSIKALAGNNNIYVYPNPVTNSFVINGCNEGDVISIINLLGREVVHYTCKANNSAETISMAELPSSVYTMQITTASGVQRTVQKIVKE